MADCHTMAGLLEEHGARKVVVPDAAHMVTIEQPEVFNQLLQEFLKEQ